METALASTDSISLDAVDVAGNKRAVQLRASIIGPRATVAKQQTDEWQDGDQGFDAERPSSKSEDESRYTRLLGDNVITPPVNLASMVTLKDESSELGQDITAMVTNTVGFGWQLKERTIIDSMRADLEAAIEAEKAMLKVRLETIHPIESLTMLRKKVHNDKHSCGNGYLELIENARGELVGVEHVPGHTIRLSKRDTTPTQLAVQRVRPDRRYAVEDVRMYYRFRRYAQVLDDDTVMWFKQAGDPRTMDSRTGKYAKNPKDVPLRHRANSLIHFKIYHPTTPYGIPIWYGNSFSIRGSRSAESVNYATLSSNAVPSMFVIVENGQLTSASIDRLREWTEKHIQNTPNYSTFLLIEGETLEDGQPNAANFRIRIEPLKSVQQKDELFQDYDANNREKIRQAFRLPPLFVGKSEDYNRATADTSRDVADEQVFAPEREDDDYLINRFILSRWGARFHQFKSNHPNITDDIELIRLMAIAEKSGAMTPRRADRIVRDVFGDAIGPLPVGIDLDRPFTITFADAQQGKPGESDGSNADPVGAIMNDIANLR